ncbi:unnamed protein product [Soboliphyme baturini]|uniref:Fas apoptotic inhibitory molecule 1 n=1 Tax=Soboliphyme baturini TaxID=241478 RepID=A0A183IGK5_9BILA|nr:unnamed protein product [Soboliphyme baturini]
MWIVPLQDKVHRIEFEHGTTTGRRVIRVDGKEVSRRNWMIKLVGREFFTVGKHSCAIDIESVGTFVYKYSLEIDGKPVEKFKEQISRLLLIWKTEVDKFPTRICLGKGTFASDTQ